MEPITSRVRRLALSGSWTVPTICAQCQLEVADPGEPLNEYMCPRCGGGLIRLSVPRESGFNRRLPAAARRIRPE